MIVTRFDPISRNYQEYVANQIADWTIAEEAKYQAMLVSEDVEQDITDAAKAAALATKEARKGARSASRSPKGGRKGSGDIFSKFKPPCSFVRWQRSEPSVLQQRVRVQSRVRRVLRTILRTNSSRKAH